MLLSMAPYVSLKLPQKSMAFPVCPLVRSHVCEIVLEMTQIIEATFDNCFYSSSFGGRTTESITF